MRAALIVGLAGAVLGLDERHFLRDCRPAGIILFARNCLNPEQTRSLVRDALDAIGADATLVLIDQEGGRVQRLRPPHWRALPSAAAYAAIYAGDRDGACRLAHLAARLTASDLRDLGINTNCAPVLDLVVPDAHDIIGDRAYGRETGQIAALGRAVADGFIAGGVVPVIKHIPGHGRALADSHLELPVVATSRSELEATDFAPFKALADMPAAMTAHVVYGAIDPEAPASTSKRVMSEVVRGGMGFDGLVMSDDLGMKALTGTFRARAEAVIAAGSDLALHCSGELGEAVAAAAGVPPLSGPALRRFEAAVAVTRVCRPFDAAAAARAVDDVLATVS